MAQILDTYLQQLPAEIQYIRKWLTHNPDKFAFDNAHVSHPMDLMRFLEVIKNHRLYPAMYKALPNFTGDLALDTDSRFKTALKTLADKNRMQMLQKVAALIKIVQAFHAYHIPVISLKGPALAAQLYGDVGMKASLDLDILIPKEHFVSATHILRDFNYIPLYDYELTPRKQNYLLNNFHHISFTGKAGNIELHWELNTNRFATGRNIEYYFENRDSILLGGIHIPVLNNQALVEYLAIHGSYHAWARLDWLYDFSVLITKNQHLLNDIRNSMDKTGNDSMCCQSVMLAHGLFGATLPGNFRCKDIFLIKTPLKQMALQYTNSKKPGFYKFRQKIYLFQLKKKWPYRIHIFSVLGTNQGDWDMLRLPDRFFFLYFFLRPILFVLRFFKKR